MDVYENLRSALANYAHNTWSNWMKYLFSQSKQNEDGSITIPKELVQRWKRQINTSYVNLPENEQKSDLDEADEILDIMLLEDHIINQFILLRKKE